MDSRRLDLILRISVAVLVTAVIAVGAYFGYSVYADRKQAQNAEPAIRVIRVMEKEARKKPNDVYIRIRLGEAYAAAGKYQQAIDQFNAAIKIDPKHVGAHLDLGLVAMAAEKPAVAKKYLEKVVKLTDTTDMQNVDDRREAAFYNLGRIAYAEKEYEAAIGYYKAALRIRDDASDTYVLLARAFVKVDEPDAAMEQLKLALAFDPNFAEANYEMGKLYAAKGDKLNAALHFRKAADVKPDEPDPAARLAELGTSEEWLSDAVKVKESDPKQALEFASIAFYIDPQNLPAARLRAQLLKATGDKAGALEAYQTVLDLAPGDKEASATIDALTPKSAK